MKDHELQLIDINLANEFIPGYNLLDKDTRTLFEATEAGELLRNAVVNKQKKFTVNITNEFYQLILECIQRKQATIATVCEHYIPVMDLNPYIGMHTQTLSNDLQNNQFQNKLKQHLQAHLHIVKKPDNTTGELLVNSWSWFLAQDAVKTGRKFLNQFAAAHGFIQATGFSLQNESTFLAWLDVNNYLRTGHFVDELMLTVVRFLQPFKPLFAEYHDINHHEQNIFKQIARTMMPLLIILVTGSMVWSVLPTFFLFELSWVPVVYFSCLAATAYVITKDTLTQSARLWWHGGQFNLPEFRINERIKTGLTNEESRAIVHDFYIHELEQCSELERHFQQKPEGTLTDAELTEKAGNRKRMHDLHGEWYDIHSNAELGADKIRDVMLNRLRLDMIEICTKRDDAFNQLITDITSDVKASLSNDSVTISSEKTSHHRFFRHNTEAMQLETLACKIR